MHGYALFLRDQPTSGRDASNSLAGGRGSIVIAIVLTTHNHGSGHILNRKPWLERTRSAGSGRLFSDIVGADRLARRRGGLAKRPVFGYDTGINPTDLCFESRGLEE
jgi:hypothetical protein